MILFYDKTAKSCVLKTDAAEWVCTFSNVELTEATIEGSGIYSVVCIDNLCRLCSLPVQTTTIVRTDTYLNAWVDAYTVQETEDTAEEVDEELFSEWLLQNQEAEQVEDAEQLQLGTE